MIPNPNGWSPYRAGKKYCPKCCEFVFKEEHPQLFCKTCGNKFRLSGKHTKRIWERTGEMRIVRY
jgi:hypothetical protein